MWLRRLNQFPPPEFEFSSDRPSDPPEVPVEDALPEGMALTPVSLGTITPLRADDTGAGNPPSAARADAAPVRDAGAFDWVHPQASMSPMAATAGPNNNGFLDFMDR